MNNNLICNNPYRVIGILSNATEREIQRQKSKIQAFIKVGKQISSEYDFPFLSSINRTEKSINESFSKLEQNKEKIKYSLFWFSNVNSFDQTAINYLKNNDKEKAIEIWEKVTHGRNITASNFSCFNNIGTLRLLTSSQEEQKKGIEAKIKLLESDYIEDFIHLVADETASIDKTLLIQEFIYLLLTELTNTYSENELIKLFDTCSEKIQKQVIQKFTEEPIHYIEREIESVKKKRKDSPENAYDLGINLYEKCKEKIAFLKSTLESGNLQFKMISDNLAKELLQCAIDYLIHKQKIGSNNEDVDKATKLAKLAQNFAIENLIKDRIIEHLKTLEGMKDRELNQAIKSLQSIKDAYEKNERKIMLEVKKQELSLFTSLDYSRSINWDKVNNLIKNSLDWDKVVEFVKESIPVENIEKIKTTLNTEKLNKYKDLVDFLYDKLSYAQEKQIGYLCYWNKTNVAKSPGKDNPSDKNKSKEEEEGYLGCIIIIIVVLAILVLFYYLFGGWWAFIIAMIAWYLLTLDK